MTLYPKKKYELTIRSAVLRSDKPNKGLEAIASNNPNQMNRLIAYLPDGTKVMVAQRPGKGGMDFNKLLGGKVFMVAADGFSPVFEKGEDKKPTKVQKKEDGLPLYSASGFYLLSSKEYPALDVIEAYTLLADKGTLVHLLTAEQLAARQVAVLESEFDWELMQPGLLEALGDANNLVARFDADINKKRKRGIERFKEECEDSGEKYEGVEFAELAVSKKDGNAVLVYAWSTEGGAVQSGAITRQADIITEEGKLITAYFSAEEALEHFMKTPEGKRLATALESGKPVRFGFAQGHVMRTSVSFRRKAENVLAAGTDKPLYGDAVYVHAGLKGWVKGLVTLMHSQHPNFPQADYDAQHYVGAPRQAEVGMDKKTDGSGWVPPQAPEYDIARALLA